MMQKILLLPFAEEGTDRKKPFTSSMEVASILCLAEARRRKKPGVLGAQPERIVFISKLHYPIWAVPLQDEAFFVDGLGIVNSSIAYSIPPETEIFLKQLEKATELRELYLILQRSHQDTFKKFLAELEIPILGLLTDHELILSLSEYAKKGVEVNKEEENLSLIAPRLSEKTVLGMAEKIKHYGEIIAAEINRLEKTVIATREDMQYREEKIQSEIEELQKRYETKLASLTAEVEKNVEALTNEKDIATQRITKLREEELKPLLTAKQKSEAQLKLLKREEEVLKKRRGLKKTGDTLTILGLENRMQENENRSLEEEGNIKVINQFIEPFQKETDELIKKLSADYEKKIEEEKNRIVQLEALRDSEISFRQNELLELRTLTATITGMIETLIGKKQAEETKLKELLIPLTLGSPTLFYVPFYLVKFETDKKVKYYVKTPSIAIGHAGFFRRIQRAIRGFSLESRVNHLLQSRSKALHKLVASTLIEIINEDKSLERNLSSMARGNNVLRKADLKEILNKGAGELRDEGWIKPEEKEEVLEAYLPKS